MFLAICNACSGAYPLQSRAEYACAYDLLATIYDQDHKRTDLLADTRHDNSTIASTL